MSIYISAILIGVLSGLRALTPLAVVSWAVRWGWLHVGDTWLQFLGYEATPYILTALAIGELLNDKRPSAPSRRAPPGFIARIVTGTVCGAAVSRAGQPLIGALMAGAVGAVAGTLGGYEFRTRLVRAIGGNDLPIALLEDAIAVGGAFLIVSRLR
jgi:uncharacterized membrane protein